MTADGGLTWQVQRGLSTETLSVADGGVFRVAYDHSGCPGPCNPMLQEAPIGSTNWRTLVGDLNAPDRSSSAQIVNSGSTVVVALYGSQAGPVLAQAILYRSLNGGNSWQQLGDPCSGRGAHGEEEDLTALASSPGGFFAGLCSPHSGNGGPFVITSTDDGKTWDTAGRLPAAEGVTALAAASPTTLAVIADQAAGEDSYTEQVVVSSAQGKHWVIAATDTQQLILQPLGLPWLGFENSEVGRWIGDARSVWSTYDGGRHWTRNAFQ